MALSEHIVSSDDGGIRLDRWFKRHYPGVPHALLEKHLRKGAVRVDGKKAKSSDRVEVGQVIQMRLQAPVFGLQKKEASPKTEIRSLKPDDIEFIRNLVLFQDSRLIVLNKPYGLPVQGGSKIGRNLDALLSGLAKDDARPKLTHRLDRDTSGCLVVAKTAKDATMLMHLFAGRRVEKTYWALVNGLPDPMKGTIDLPLAKKANPKAEGNAGGPHGRDYEVVQVDEEEGQKAVTEYRVIDHLARKFALVELKPQTGRMHQLRVHMAAIGCPILGDHKYGGGNDAAASVGVENILHLHARRIEIPLSGKAVDVTAPLPPHMVKSFKALGLDVPKS